MPKRIDRCSLVFALAIFGAAWLCASPDDPSDWKPDRWAAWRDRQIARIFTPTFSTAGGRVLARRQVIEESAKAEAFLAPFAADPGFLEPRANGQVLDRFARFVKAQGIMDRRATNGEYTNSLGLTITDREYIESTASVLEFPDLLKSQSFQWLLSDPKTYKMALEMIEAQNEVLPENQKWLAYFFRTQFILSVDQRTYGRLLVIVPGHQTSEGMILDRWIQFAVATPDQSPKTPICSVSEIVVLRNTSRPGVSKAYMADFMRERDCVSNEVRLTPNAFLSPSPSSNCYDCHKSAVLPIYPEQVYQFSAKGDLTEKSGAQSELTATVHSFISRYGKTDFGPIDVAAYGPCIGPSHRNRSDSFIVEATKAEPIDRSSYPAIRENMDCAKCHDGFAKINYQVAVRSDRDAKAFKNQIGLVRAFIEKGFMPPNNTLTAAERRALWRCLSKEYFDPDSGTGILIDWLKGKGN